MRKTLSILALLIGAVPAYAATMCVDDDTLVIALDPGVNGTGNNNGTGMEWTVQFGYGTVYGISACINRGGTTNVAVPNLTDTDGTTVVGGEISGVQCWCKMTHPVVSGWTFRDTNNPVSACGSVCANHCGAYVGGDSSCRVGVFGSVGN